MNIYKIKHSIARRVFKILNSRNFKYIGKKSFIYKPIYLSKTEFIWLGDYSEIWNGARIECITSFGGQSFSPELKIGNNTIINQNCHITCASKIIIGDDVGISHGVTITDISHNTFDYSKSVLNQGITTDSVYIGDGTTIGTNAVILKGVSIGKHAVIGANAVVTKDVPDYKTAVGIPAKILNKEDL